MGKIGNLSDCNRGRIWNKRHVSMDPTFVPMIQVVTGSVMLWGIFPWHTLGTLVPIKYLLNTAAFLRIVADHVPQFMKMLLQSCGGFFKQDNAACHKSNRVADWFMKHSSELLYVKVVFIITEFQSYKSHLVCNGNWNSDFGYPTNRFWRFIAYHISLSTYFERVLVEHRRNYAKKNWGDSTSKRGERCIPTNVFSEWLL